MRMRLPARCLPILFVAAHLVAQSPPAIRIVVIDGEAAVNVIQQKTATAPVVEVRDRNNQPVAGAVVRFAIQGGRATFGAGNTNVISVTTNTLGRAAAGGLTPTASGSVQIAATATFQGQTAAAVTITQTNVMTAAQAAAVSSAASSGSGGTAGSASAAGTAGSAAGGGAAATTGAAATAGAAAAAGTTTAGTAGTAAGTAATAGTAGTATAGTAAAAGTAGIGGGLSATTIGIVGGAAAAGTVVATKVLVDGFQYSGTFGGTMQMNNGPLVSGLPGGCTRNEAQTGTIKMDITNTNGTITGKVDIDGNVTVSHGSCLDISSNNGADTFGGGTDNVTGTPNNVTFTTSDSNANGTSIYNYSFVGTFDGTQIIGALTINRVLTPDGSGTIVYQVTLR